MKLLNHTTRFQQTQSPRNGLTLTEVLMSLMIMGIGVVSLATLFPISTTRVIEASNLTNSTILRFNAEGLVDSFPNLIHNPDGDATTRETGRNYIVDPLGWHEHVQQLQLTAPDDPALIYFEYNRPSAVTLPLLIGVDSQGNSVPRASRYFGESPTAPQLFTTLEITRALASLPDSSTGVAEGFPDETGTNAAAYVLNGANRVIGLVLPNSMDVSVAALAPSLYRAVIYDKSGRYSEVRQLSVITGQQITWAQDLNGNGNTTDPGEDLPLPLRFTQDINALPNIGLVQIQQPVPHYSWMLTVRRRASGPANVDVVVFSNRDFSQLSEQVYVGAFRRYTLGPDGAPGMAGVDDNSNGITDDASEIGYPPNPPVNTADDQLNNTILVDWDPALYTTAPEKPPIRRGRYIFDPVNGLWYRVQSIRETPTATSALLALESSIARNSTEDVSGDGTLGDIPGEDLNNDGTLDTGGVIIPFGVVAVFPLETKLP
jgi:prepilin-type N-terminal cleavage/methylation domain-containing protein